MNGMNARTGAPLSGAAHIEQSVADILATPLGTRLARRWYGSFIPELLDQPMNAMLPLRLYAATALALYRNEPRLRLSRVAIARGAAPGSAVIRIVGTRTDVTNPRRTVDLTVPVRSLTALTA
ncbi:GPW/gp25 family protein [Sphingomonas sp.]|jgi:hypothetical protein|uniref:GPW/gp25 family protein n=1 Tax=Sphingomonas sp. TaxID=28214 RepID=UPI003565805D